MSNQDFTPTRSLGQTLRLVGSSEAFTKRVILWSLLFALFVSVIYDGSRFGTSRVGWLVIALVAHAFAAIVMLILRLWWLPKSPYSPRPFATVSIFAIGSASRSAVIAELSYSMNLAPEMELGYRLLAGALLGTLTLSIVALISAVTKDHADSENQLRVERESLVMAQENAEKLVEDQREEIAQIVRESIEPSLQEISRNLSESTIQDSEKLQSAAKAISGFIDQKLRPLSSSLHRKQEIQIPRVELIGIKPSIISIPKFFVIREVLSPLAVFVVFAIPNITGAFPYVGYRAVPAVIVMYLPMLLIQTTFLRFPFTKHPMKSGIAIPILFVLFATSWYPAVLIARKIGINEIDQFGLIPGLIAGSLITGFLVTYSFLIDNQRMAYVADLRHANQELDLELNRTAQQIWHVRQHAAQVLHGSVQASLTAANMRILGAIEINEDLLGKVQEDVIRANDALATMENVIVDLQTSFNELVELWQGMCQIQIYAPALLIENITKNQVTAHCVNEIVKECVNNAIRHGHAKQVDVKVEDLMDGSLQVTVVNDGAANILGEQGVGSQILDEITMHWTRELIDSRVIVTAQVASGVFE